jgi:hypothetical protein
VSTFHPTDDVMGVKRLSWRLAKPREANWPKAVVGRCHEWSRGISRMIVGKSVNVEDVSFGLSELIKNLTLW